MHVESQMIPKAKVLKTRSRSLNINKSINKSKLPTPTRYIQKNYLFSIKARSVFQNHPIRSSFPSPSLPNPKKLTTSMPEFPPNCPYWYHPSQKPTSTETKVNRPHHTPQMPLARPDRNRYDTTSRNSDKRFQSRADEEARSGG